MFGECTMRRWRVCQSLPLAVHRHLVTCELVCDRRISNFWWRVGDLVFFFSLLSLTPCAYCFLA